MSLLMPGFTRYVKIPELFYSEATKQRFQFCIECKKYLLNSGKFYIIEKAVRNFKKFKKRDIVFEYALCSDCEEAIWHKMSKSSAEKLEEYYSRNIDYQSRMRKFEKLEEQDLDKMTSNCLIKDKSTDEVDEYILVAFCIDENIIVHYSPYMICGEAMDEIVQLMSNKTIDVIDDFVGRNLGIPPEFKVKDKPRMVFT